MKRRFHRLLVAFVAALIVLLVAAPSVFAHAAFLGSDPVPGQRVERSPTQIAMRFTEAINRRLSTAALYDAVSGKRVRVDVGAPSARQLVLTSPARLDRGSYRVEWHSVSADDGHALEGSFSFGVRATALGGARTTQAGPLADGGCLRVLVRALLYPALFVFVGALLLAALLPAPDRVPWIVPRDALTDLARSEADALIARYWRIVLDAGALAAGLAALSALLDARDAAGGFSWGVMRDYLTTGTAGVGRVAVVAFVMLAVGAARRLPYAAALAAVLALGAMAIAGHAHAASPRAGAIVTDWIHLLAATVWVGGIGLIVLTWAPTVRRSGPLLRLAAMRHVLARFGRVALPAFIVVALTGSLNALIELGRVSALWQTGYGRVLMVKVALVGLIAAASYMHALRLRPQLLAANPHPEPRSERRHWRLLGAEPLLGVGVGVAVALLLAFPPPRPSSEVARAAPVAQAACDPCPLAKAKPHELAVAEEGGSDIVAAWIRRRPGGLEGEVRLINVHGKPSSTPFEIETATTIAVSCGLGCRRFKIPSLPSTLRVIVVERGHEYTAVLPTVWHAGESRRARQLLNRAQAVMRRLRSVREIERVNSVPGITAITRYRLKAPDRFAYTNALQRAPHARTRLQGESVVIAKTQWNREPGRAWQKSQYGGGLRFRTKSWFRWSAYAIAVRLLDVHREHGRPVAVLALMDPGTPAWWRLWIDLDTMRVIRDRLIASGHFMTQRYVAFNEPLEIQPPTR